MHVVGKENYTRLQSRWSNKRKKCTGLDGYILMLNCIMWYRNVSKINKIEVYNIIIKRILTYSSNIWQKIINTTEYDF